MNSTTLGTIHTLGYAAKDADEQLAQLMTDERTLLVDIRLSAHSRWHPRFNENALMLRYEARYKQRKRLGNINYRNKALPIVLAEGHEQSIAELVALLRSGRNIVLLCACSQYEQCHRKVVAELLRDAMAIQEEIQPC